MKTFWWIPRPATWASAVALFVYALGVSFAFGAVMPFIGELMRHSPRLGWLAVLGVWTSPIVAAGALHHAAHGVLDLGDSQKVARWPSSLWAGFVAWVAIIFVSSAAGFVMLVIDPPPIDESSFYAMASLTSLSSGGALAIIHVMVWVTIAAEVYALEQAARRDV